MRAHRVETVVQRDSELRLMDIPFRAGARVEVIVREQAPRPDQERWQRLRGTVLRYDEPTEPVGVEDWEAMK